MTTIYDYPLIRAPFRKPARFVVRGDDKVVILLETDREIHIDLPAPVSRETWRQAIAELERATR